jgi:uncharacterized protein (UPF0332 family)
LLSGGVGGSHQAVIDAFEYYFHCVPKKGKIEEEHLQILKTAAEIEADYVDYIKGAKNARTTAQYEVTAEIQERDAKFIVENVPKFIDRVESLLDDLGFPIRRS